MSAEREAKLRRVLEEVFIQRNVAAMDELFTPGIVRQHPPLPEIKGLQAYKEYNQGVLDAWSNVRFIIHEVIFAADTSAVRFTFEATHSGQTPLTRVPPTGRQVTMQACDFAHWEGDRIAEEWVYADFLGLLQQIGGVTMPAMGS